MTSVKWIGILLAGIALVPGLRAQGSPAPVTAVIERARYVISVPPQGPAQGLLELDIHGLEEGWHSVPILGGELVFVGLEGGDDLLLTGAAGAPRLWLPGSGPRKVRLRFEAPVPDVSSDRRALQLVMPASPIHHVEIEFPGRKVRMTGPWASGEGERFTFPLPARDRVELTWSEPPREGSSASPGWLEGPEACRMETLFTVHPGWIFNTTLLHLQDDDARARQFSFSLPAGWRHLRVATRERGLSVPFTLEPRDDHHIVSLPSLPGERGPWDLVVSFSQAIPSPGTPAHTARATTATVLVEPPPVPIATVALPFLVPMGVERVGGEFVLSPSPDVEASLLDREGTTEGDLDELSPPFRELLRGFVVTARSFGTVPAATRIEIRHRLPATRSYPLIGTLHGETEITPEGHVMSRVFMHVTNATAPHLELALAAGAELSSMRVDGIPVLPPTISTSTASGEPGPGPPEARYRMPLKSSLEGGLVHFTVELEYAERFPLAAGFGRLAWNLPTLRHPVPGSGSTTGAVEVTSLPVGHIGWQVRWPASIVPVRIESGRLAAASAGAHRHAMTSPVRGASPAPAGELWRTWPPEGEPDVAGPEAPAQATAGAAGLTFEHPGGSPVAPGSIEIDYVTMSFLEAYRTLLFLCAIAFLISVFWYPDSSTMLTVSAGATVLLGLLGSTLLEGTGEVMATALIAFVFLHGMRWAASPTEEGD